MDDNIDEVEKRISGLLESLQNQGAEGRWLAIARTDLEKGVLELRHAWSKRRLGAPALTAAVQAIFKAESTPPAPVRDGVLKAQEVNDFLRDLP